MRMFGIALETPNAEVKRRIEEAYPEPDNYRLSDTFYLVMCDTLADTVAKTVGLYGEKRIQGASGVVVRLARRHAGQADSALWDWFRACRGTPMSNGSEKKRAGKSSSKSGGGDTGDMRDQVARLKTQMKMPLPKPISRK